MIIDSGVITGSLVVSGSYNQTGSAVINGDLTVTGVLNATISGSATSASYAATASLAPSYLLTSSFNDFSGSASTRLTNLESTSSTLTSASASFASSINSLEGVTGSYATTGSNQFYGSQTITGNIILSGSSQIQSRNPAASMLFGMNDSGTIYGPFYHVYGNNFSNTNLRGSLDFVYDTSNGGLSGFNISSYDGFSLIRKVRVADSGIQITGSLEVTGGASGSFSGSFQGESSGVFQGQGSGSFSGSFQGNGSGLTNVPASGIVGLQLNQIASGSVTASIAPDKGFTVNTNSQITGSLIVTNGVSGSFSGSFQGNGSGLTNVPASGIVGLQLNQIGSGSVTASIAPDLGFRVNTNSQITGSLIVSNGITGNLVGQVTGSFSGSLYNLQNTLLGHIPFFSQSQILADSAILQVDNGLDQGYSIAINQNGVDTTNPEALFVYQASTSSFNVVSGKGNLNNYLQLNIQNLNNGANASSDVVATANNGNETTNFIDMGINGANFSGPIGNPNDAYLYSTGENLHIGNASSGSQHLGFFVGGDDVVVDNKLQLNPGNLHELTGSLNASAGFTGSLQGNATTATSASYAATASFGANFTASNALINNTLTAQTLIVQTVTSSVVYSSGSNIFGNLLTNTQQLTGSVTVTGSLAVNESNVILTNQTSSMSVLSSSYALSASYAAQGLSASYAITASYAQNAQTASYVTLAQTASYVLNAVSASYALDADLLDGKDSTVFATTGSNTFIGSQTVTGSLLTSGSNTLIGNTELTGSIGISGSQTFVGINTITGSVNISGSTTQVGNNTLLGNTVLSGSIIISGSTAPGNLSASVNIFGDTAMSGFLRFNPYSTNIDTSISASYIYVSGSTNDLYFAQNTKGYTNTTRLRWLEGNLYTGLLNGGLIVSQSSTVYQVTSGSGIIVTLNASLNDNPYPTVQYLNWDNLSASIDPLTSSYQQAFVGIQSNGTIFQQGTPFTSVQNDAVISVGNVLFQNGSTINGVKTQPYVAYGLPQRQDIFISAFGPLKLSGFTLAPSGSSTGSLVVGSGTAFSDGANYVNDPNSPSYVTDAGTSTSKIFRYYQSGSTWVYDTNGGAGYGAINPGQYSNNGTLTTVQPGDWSIQRVFWFPNSVAKAIVVYYGNAVYDTEIDAVANINIETFVEAPNTAANAIYLGAIVISGNGVFTTPADFKLVPGGLFRAVGGSGGGGSVVTQTLAGLSDVAISGETNLQPFAYSTTAGKWINTSILSASIVGNATTATSASYAATSSWALNAINANTASYVEVAQTASYVLNAVSASYSSTASYVEVAQTASFVTTAQTASYVLNAVSSSYALTASYAANVPVTASYALTASYVEVAQTASYVLNAVSASRATSAANADTASFVATAQTASYVLNAVSASYATTASAADTFTANEITASNILVNGTVTAQILNVQQVTSSIVYSSGSNIFGNLLTDSQQLTGSVTITGSLEVNGRTPLYIDQTSSLSVTSASYAATASHANSTATVPFTVGGTATYYGTVPSSTVGSNNVFTLNTGSYTAAKFLYTVTNGSNARTGEILAVWNDLTATAVFTDASTTDIGTTSDVTASVSIVSSQVQLNFQTNSSFWTIKSQATFI